MILLKRIIANSILLSCGLLIFLEGCKQNNLPTDSSIHYAAVTGNVAMVKNILKNGVSIDIKDSKGATPLILSIMAHQTEMTYFLLSQGADVNAYAYLDEIDFAITAIITAVIFDADCSLLETLANAGSNINTIIYTRKYRYSLLQYTIVEKDLKTVKCLVSLGAHVNAKVGGISPMQYARRLKKMDIVKLLIKSGSID